MLQIILMKLSSEVRFNASIWSQVGQATILTLLLLHQWFSIWGNFASRNTWYGEGNGTPLQCSCLENPMDEGAWWAAVHGITKSRTRLSDFTFTFHFHALEKDMATYSSVIAWRIPRMGEPGGLLSMGSHRVGHDWSDLSVAAAVPYVRRNYLITFYRRKIKTWIKNGNIKRH